MDTERDSRWPPGQQRSEDHEWFSVVKRYDGVILLVITFVLILGGLLTWQDRRDYTAMFTKITENSTALTSQVSAMKAVLDRLEGQVSVLSRQNASWVSWERELHQLRELMDDLPKLRERVQRLEDQR